MFDSLGLEINHGVFFVIGGAPPVDPVKGARIE
jgi:hypothetical protein